MLRQEIGWEERLRKLTILCRMGRETLTESTTKGTTDSQTDLSREHLLVHGQVTIIFVVSVCLSVCLCRVFLSRL